MLGQTTAPPKNPQDQLADAQQKLEHGQPAAAIALLQPLAGATPAVKGAAHELGVAYYRTGRLTDALQAFTQAEREDPNDMESVQLHGLTLYRLGRPADAIPYLQRVRQWMPNADADANHVLGLCSSQEQSLLDELASPNFQTDWGTRSTSTASSVFDPDSYAKGSVWAVGTAEAATAFWDGHRPETAFAIWSGLIPWNTLDSLGHMDEVLAGDYYHEQTESVPEQIWSSASFFHAAVSGLLGLQVDGASRQILLAPHLPADWKTLTLRNVRLQKANVDFVWRRTDEGSVLQAVNSGDPIHLIYSPEIPLGSTLKGARWNGKPIQVRLEEHAQDSHANVDVELPHGTSQIALTYSGGVSLVLPPVQPLLGDTSHALKLIRVKLSGSTYTVDAQVDSSQAAHFQLRTDRKVVDVHGATWKAASPETYEMTVPPSEGAEPSHGYHAVQIVVSLAPR